MICKRCSKSFERKETSRKPVFCSRLCSDSYKKESAYGTAQHTLRVGKKQCKDCSKYLELAKFPPSTQSKDGYKYYCYECMRAYNRLQNGKRAGRRYDYGRKIQLKRYGITPDDYSALLEKQLNRCAICLVEPGEKKILAVDHCHETKKVRGLLCENCNRGLGMFKDNIDTLLNAIDYLRIN